MADAKLVVTEGPNAGREFDLEGSMVMGRDPSVALVLDDAEASRRHASISAEGGIATVEDLGSTNGTFVNGERIAGSRTLSDGDTLRIGTTTMIFSMAVEATRVATAIPGEPGVDATRVGTPAPGGPPPAAEPPTEAPPAPEPVGAGPSEPPGVPPPPAPQPPGAPPPPAPEPPGAPPSAAEPTGAPPPAPEPPGAPPPVPEPPGAPPAFEPPAAGPPMPPTAPPPGPPPADVGGPPPADVGGPPPAPPTPGGPPMPSMETPGGPPEGQPPTGPPPGAPPPSEQPPGAPPTAPPPGYGAPPGAPPAQPPVAYGGPGPGTGYPAEVQIDYPQQGIARWRPIFHGLLLFPNIFVLWFVLIAAYFRIIGSWFAVVFTGRYPPGLFNGVVGALRWATRVNAYAQFMVDKYPPYSTMDDPSYPARLRIDYPPDGKIARWRPLVHWLLVIPHAIVLGVLQFGALFALIGAWFAVVFTRRYPPGLFNFILGTMRWGMRVSAYSLWMREEYPPFSLE